MRQRSPIRCKRGPPRGANSNRAVGRQKAPLQPAKKATRCCITSTAALVARFVARLHESPKLPEPPHLIAAPPSERAWRSKECEARLLRYRCAHSFRLV